MNIERAIIYSEWSFQISCSLFGFPPSSVRSQFETETSLENSQLFLATTCSEFHLFTGDDSAHIPSHIYSTNIANFNFSLVFEHFHKLSFAVPINLIHIVQCNGCKLTSFKRKWADADDWWRENVCTFYQEFTLNYVPKSLGIFARSVWRFSQPDEACKYLSIC